MSAHCTIDARKPGQTLTLLEISGEFDVADAERFEALAMEALARQDDVVVDLAGTSFVDLVSFGAIVRCDAGARALGRRLVVVVDATLNPLARFLGLTRARLDITTDAACAVGALIDERSDPVSAASLNDAQTALRERIFDGMIHEVARVGWDATSVPAVVAGARVSREEFYELFASRLDCYRQALRARLGDQYRRWLEDLDGPGEPLEGPRRALEQYLSRLAAQPAAAYCYLLENPSRRGVGAVRLANRRSDVVRALHRRLGSRRWSACHGFVAGVPTLASDYVALGRAAELPSLVDPLVASLEAITV